MGEIEIKQARIEVVGKALEAYFAEHEDNWLKLMEEDNEYNKLLEEWWDLDAYLIDRGYGDE